MICPASGLDAGPAAAFAEASTAIDVLKAQMAAAIALAQTAQADLDRLIIQAGGQPAPSKLPARPGGNSSPESVVAAAYAQASAGIASLQHQVADHATGWQAAQVDLARLIVQAGGAPPA